MDEAEAVEGIGRVLHVRSERSNGHRDSLRLHMILGADGYGRRVDYRTDVDYKLMLSRGDQETTVEPVRFLARSTAWWAEAGRPEDSEWLLTFETKEGEQFTVKEGQIIGAELRPHGEAPL